jgi:hypothetical protein
MIKPGCCIPIILLVLACGKGTHDTGTAIYGVRIHYIDSNKNDLFSISDNGQNGYWIDSLQLFDITTGKKTLPSCYENGHSYQFQPLNILRLDICENEDFANRYSYTLIQLKKGVQDTIKIHINRNSVSLSTDNDSVWYNGLYRIYDSTGSITVTK